MTTIRTVGVIGMGTMGSGIAQVFAQAEFSVLVHDASIEALDCSKQQIERSLGRFVQKGEVGTAERDAVLGRIIASPSLEALAPADFIVEAVVEDLEIKRRLFAALDSLVRPDVILASNTSSISVTALAGATSRPDRVLGMHFMNPAPVMLLVELVRAEATSDASMRVASDLCVALKKTAVESADYPGFISNRILMPMINEAIFVLMEGVGSAPAIDTVMKVGMNHPMGPLTLADFIGLDVCLAILNVMHEGLGDPKYRPCPLLRRMVAAGHLGRKSGRGFYDYSAGARPR